MRTLSLPTEKVEVWKTGLPFYDAARLIGRAHRMFSTSTVEVEDEGSRWVIRGPKVKKRTARQLSIPLDGFRVRSNSLPKLRTFIGENLLSDNWGDNKGVTLESPVYFYLESALQQGTRGLDPLVSYAKLASENGVAFSQSLEEVGDATLGTAFAATSKGQQREGERRILPVIAGGHLVLGPFLDFRNWFQHEAGVFVATVLASLAILEEIIGRDLPVIDFAYNWFVPREQSCSGYVGVDRVCRLMKKRKDEGRDFHFARQARDYLSDTSSRNAGASEHDLARAIARFATTADVKHLETIVRLKARLMAQEDGWPKRRAQRLFANREAVQEVKDMAGQTVEVPEGMTWALARWFTGAGSDGWIGQFIKLENASSADRFLDEAERILSRARMHKLDDRDPLYQRHREDSHFYSYSASPDEQETIARIRGIQGPQFRSLKAIFLLDLQSKMTYHGRMRGQTPGDADTAQPNGGNDNE